jgi:hypothetical protein
MPSFEMWRRVGLLYTDVSEERVASIFRVEDIMRAKKSVRRLQTDWLHPHGTTSHKMAFFIVTAVEKPQILHSTKLYIKS